MREKIIAPWSTVYLMAETLEISNKVELTSVVKQGFRHATFLVNTDEKRGFPFDNIYMIKPVSQFSHYDYKQPFRRGEIKRT